ncbi:hypothetical protein BBO99_00004387 [Phytophthora kernoviae]|uniref:SAP domain-containing protein n=2 Tax=Phytophthora kernoviae TaxID=325452 RepID=A0A3R7IIB6_9STRA|nr:hypothetical protein G195_005738 [Phytophthora kernoviae 00238/432]KAG2524272.1 hypothetical protein JM16_005054 [Phytophthora kernoviae]KAG2526087.1 hypothetical protein JM18_004556 [Phytophthora kernoviae]RLN15306.1 hypothetical protein BBI17_004558 [Phytophthora kernoviae]RLN80605.1 hypothetical protein BBO99_00004387 [Phytophthora kernoviae]
MRDSGKPGAAGGGKSRKKREKGGTRKFVTSLEEMTLRDEQEEQKQSARKARRDDGEDDNSDDSEEGSSSEEEGEPLVAFERVQSNSLFGFSTKADGPTLQEEKKKVGFAAIAKTKNPNAKKSANKVMKAKDMDGDAAPQQLSRREREAIEKERSQAYYLKKHLAGETDEAKKDLARLKEVKRRREEADQRKKEEEDAAAEREKSKKKVEVKDNDEPLDARAIKALKPGVLKEKLKERKLSTQGQKKELIQRLIDYENERAL